MWRTTYRYDYSFASQMGGGGFLINMYHKDGKLTGISTSNSDRIGTSE